MCFAEQPIAFADGQARVRRDVYVPRQRYEQHTPSEKAMDRKNTRRRVNNGCSTRKSLIAPNRAAGAKVHQPSDVMRSQPANLRLASAR